MCSSNAFKFRCRWFGNCSYKRPWMVLQAVRSLQAEDEKAATILAATVHTSCTNAFCTNATQIMYTRFVLTQKSDCTHVMAPPPLTRIARRLFRGAAHQQPRNCSANL